MLTWLGLLLLRSTRPSWRPVVRYLPSAKHPRNGWGYRGERDRVPSSTHCPADEGVDRDVDNKKMTSYTNFFAKP